MSISSFIPGGVYPGAIVLVRDFPYEEDRHQGKTRPVFVVHVVGNRVAVHGIYSGWYPGRVPIPRTSENGLTHDSYVDPRIVDIDRGRIIKPLGDTSTDFDPFDDCAAA